MVTGKKFRPSLTKNVTCDTKNIIYCIKCTVCDVLYVGETKRSLRERISEHLGNIKNKKGSSVLVSHFMTCRGQVKVTILDMIDDVTDDDNVKASLLQKENKWIRVLNTAYPFGLNDNIKGYGLTREITDPTQSKNPPYLNHKVLRNSRSHGIKKRKNKEISVYSNWDELKDVCNIVPKTERYRKLYTALRSFNRVSFINCLNNLQGSRCDNDEEAELKLAILAIASNGDKKKQKKDKNIKRFCMPFHKIMDDINIMSIIMDKRCWEKIPNVIPARFNIVFTYDKPLSITVCNYGHFLKRINNQDIENILSSSCECANSNYRYDQTGHIITGDLSIVGPKLAALLAKGAKYRPTRKPNHKKLNEDFQLLLQNITTWIAKNQGLHEREFIKYKEKCLWLFNNRLKNAIKNMLGTNKFALNNYYCVEQDFKKIHEKYIITVADKAPNNFIIICKKYYTMILCKELGITLANSKIEIKGNDVYIPTTEKIEEIINKHDNLLQRFQGKIDNKNKCLPRLFATPKLHKNPYKFRFISGASVSSIKKASIILHRALQFFKNHFMAYTNIVKERSHNETCWTIKGCQDVHNLYHKIEGKKIDKIITADFSTMFTAFEHADIVSNVNQLIELCFKNSGKPVIAIGPYKTWYSKRIKNTTGRTIFLDKYDCYNLVDTIVNNTYITFADNVFRQVKGVPMGGNASPMLADLSLAMLEYNFLRNKNNREQAQNLQYTRRYIDDVLCINGNNFTDIAKQIYPKSLTLEITSTIDKATFLDTQLKISQDNRLEVRIYNKTDYFNFKVVRYVDHQSNMSEKVGYNIYYGELIRYSRITNITNVLCEKIAALTKEFLSKGYEQCKLIQKLNTFMTQYSSSLYRFKIHTDIDKWNFAQLILKLAQ